MKIDLFYRELKLTNIISNGNLVKKSSRFYETVGGKR
jgi:hypothetical protein